MGLKVYVLEFTFFSGVAWKRVTIEVTALSKIQLMKAFLTEVQYLNNYSILRFHSKKEAIKDLWNKNKGYIVEKDLKFPIVNVQS